MMSHEVVGQIGLRAGHDAKTRRRPGGFTLLELLIVIGIIALLMTLLFTAVSKVRAAQKRVQCMSNLRTIGAAIHQYLIDNNDTFPLAASYSVVEKPGDFLYWQSVAMPGTTTGNQFAIDLVGIAGVGKYIPGLDDSSLSGLSAVRCPSDNRLDAKGFLTNPGVLNGTAHPYTAITGSIYPYSYVISAFMVSGNYPLLGPDSSTIARTFSKVKDAASKIMVYEEDDRTINDAVGNLQPNASNTNLLSVRHQLREPLDQTSLSNPPDPDAPIQVTITPPQPPTNLPQIGTMNHKDASGNVLFADGHAETVSRVFAHSKAHYAPDPDAPILAPMP